mmetsp:Transcript_25286/g.60141  ORF Transcript_25286/g.60141 Transcript_25286/m.60141 type:complete len:239 (-) Transcript_25286:1106-1822(-)
MSTGSPKAFTKPTMAVSTSMPTSGRITRAEWRPALRASRSFSQRLGSSRFLCAAASSSESCLRSFTLSSASSSFLSVSGGGLMSTIFVSLSRTSRQTTALAVLARWSFTSAHIVGYNSSNSAFLNMFLRTLFQLVSMTALLSPPSAIVTQYIRESCSKMGSNAMNSDRASPSNLMPAHWKDAVTCDFKSSPELRRRLCASFNFAAASIFEMRSSILLYSARFSEASGGRSGSRRLQCI